MDKGERIDLVGKMVGLVNQLYLMEACCPCEPERAMAEPKKSFLLCSQQKPETGSKSAGKNQSVRFFDRTPLSTYQSDYSMKSLCCCQEAKNQGPSHSSWSRRKSYNPSRDPGTKTHSGKNPQHRSHHCDATPPKDETTKIYTPTSYKEGNTYFPSSNKNRSVYNTQEQNPCFMMTPLNKQKSKTYTPMLYKECNTYSPTANTNSTPAYNTQEQKPCFMIKCKPHKCKTNPNDEPLITWTPVMEIRKTTNAKMLEKQNDDPITRYVYVEPPGCPYQPVWSTKDPMCEKYCGPPPGCPALGPPPGYKGEPIELCCPSGKGPPVDRWGQPYECKQTLDGRPVCKPTKEAGPADWCDPKNTPFRLCNTMEESQRKSIPSAWRDQNGAKRTTSLYKRPVWPRKDNCYDSSCKSPNNPGNKQELISKPTVESRGLTFCCCEI